MTQRSESRKEAVGPTPFLTSRTLTRVATWNIRTMYEAGRTVQVARDMEELQDWSSRTERDKVATDRTAEIVIRRAAVVFGTHGGWSPPH